eukprot:snap_masked-scaffold_91-processed-gene-0.38-mRNA-1 protein AED:0.44 eAED:0.45 QI:0/-1/0/1/-1/1/1/0/2328
MTEENSNNVPRVNIGARELRFIEETRRSLGLPAAEEKENNNEGDQVENEDQMQDDGNPTQDLVENTPTTTQSDGNPRDNSNEDPFQTPTGNQEEMRMISQRDFNNLMSSLVGLRREVERNRSLSSRVVTTTPRRAASTRTEILTDNIPLTFSSTTESSESDGTNVNPREGISMSPRSRRMERKARLREERYKDKPILKTLDPSEVTKFISEFDIYETTVIHQRFALPSADLNLNLSNEVKVDLVEEGYDMRDQAKIIKYLRKIKRNEDKSRSKVVIREIDNLVWKNTGSPSASMSEFIKSTDKILRGITFSNKSMEKELCLKIIKRLPIEFGSARAKERQTEEGWKTYKSLKKGLRKAALSISTWDIQSPALQHQKFSKSRKNTSESNNSQSRRSGSQYVSRNSGEVKIIVLQTGHKKHIVPRSWPIEKRRKYSRDNNLCGYCFTEGHHAAQCPVLRRKESDQNRNTRDQDRPDRNTNLQRSQSNVAPQVNQISSSENKTSGDNNDKNNNNKEGEVKEESEIEISANNLDPVDFPEMYVLEVSNRNEVYEVVVGSDVEPLSMEWDEDFESEHATRSMYRDEISDEIIEGEHEVVSTSSKPYIETPEMQEVLKNKIREKISELVENNIVEPNQADDLEEVMVRNKDAFAFKEAKCDFNLLTPMQVKIKSDCESFTAKPYPMKKQVLEELKIKIQELLDMGMVYREPNPFFSSPVMILPKPKRPTDFRMVVDLRRVNKNCLPTGLGLPDLEAQLGWLKGNEEWFGSFDGLSGFDYLRLDPSSSKYFGMVTPIGTYCMTMSPQGFRNTPQVYQERLVNEVLNGSEVGGLFGNGALQWLDDTLLYHQTFSGYLQLLEQFLKNCIKVKFKLNLDKCDILRKKVKWCGHVIEGGHWGYDENYFSKITKMPRPGNLGHLYDVVYVSTWLSDTIPGLSESKSYLNSRMREIEGIIVENRGKRINKDARKRISIAEFWTDKDQAEYAKFLKNIENCKHKRMKMFEAESQVAIFADASNNYWSSVVALYVSDGWEPVFFVSGEFTQSSKFWSMTDKEIYPIIRTLKRYRFLLINISKEIKIFTDHLNIKYLMTGKRDVKQSTFGRIQRWILTIQEFNIVFYHIPGNRNVLADLLTRWGYLGATSTSSPEKILIKDTNNWTLTWKGIKFSVEEKEIDLEKKKISNINKDDQEPSMINAVENEVENWRFDPANIQFVRDRVGKNFPKRRTEWEDLSSRELKQIQKRDKVNQQRGSRINKQGLIVNKEGKILIHFQHLEKFIVLAHNISNHGSNDEVIRLLKDFEFIEVNKSQIHQLVRKLKKYCLHCDKDIKLERRFYKEIPHAVNENELLLHSDFLKIYDGYLLVLVEGVSRKVMMVHDKSASAHVVVKALVKWRAENGIPPSFKLSTDNGSHFSNQIIREFNKIYGGQHHFSVVYSPWSNGSVEVMNRFILRNLRQMCSEYNLPYEQWPELIDIVADTINDTPTRQGYTPNELTSIFGKKNGLAVIEEGSIKLMPLVRNNELIIPNDAEKFVNNCKILVSTIEEKRKKIMPLIEKDRKTQRDYINRKFKMSHVQFAPGDFVLMSNVGTLRNKSKLQLRWNGPYVVEEILGSTTYKIRALDGKIHVAHVQRLSLYEAQPTDFEVTSEIKKAFYYNQGIYEVHRLLDIRRSTGGFEILVWWKGFPKQEANWQNFDLLLQDIPKTLEKYINKHKYDSNDFIAAWNVLRHKLDLPVEAEVNFLREAVHSSEVTWTTDFWKVISYPQHLKLLNDHVYPGLSRSKGWNQFEKEVMQKCIFVFGLGKWEPIIKEGYLPGKTRSQLVEFVKTSIGSQRLYEFHGLKIDLNILKKYNDSKNSVIRRNGVIINTGKELSKSDLKKIRKEVWKQLYSKQNFKITQEMIPLLGIKEISNSKLSLQDISKVIKRGEKKAKRSSVPEICEIKYTNNRHLNLEIKGEIHSVLLDSGAWRSCVGENLIQGYQIISGDLEHQKMLQCKSVSGNIIEVLGYVVINCTLKGEKICVRMNKMRFYVLKCNTNKFILGEDWLRKMNIDPIKKLEEKCEKRDNRISVNEVNKEEKKDKLIEWRELYESEIEKIYRRKKYRDNLSSKLKDKSSTVKWVPYGNIEDSFFTIEIDNKEEYRDLILWKQPENSKLKIANILDQNLTAFGKFGVLLIDPPWNNQASGSPTRGLTIHYPTLTDSQLLKINFGTLVEEGIAALWITNNKFEVGRNILSRNGFRIVEYIVWCKKTAAGRIHSSQGQYLRHSKEILLLAVKGRPLLCKQRSSDVIISRVLQQSRKPREVYDLLEKLAPGVRKMEIFGRFWNCRSGWWTFSGPYEWKEEV